MPKTLGNQKGLKEGSKEITHRVILKMGGAAARPNHLHNDSHRLRTLQNKLFSGAQCNIIGVSHSLDALQGKHETNACASKATHSTTREEHNRPHNDKRAVYLLSSPMNNLQITFYGHTICTLLRIATPSTPLTHHERYIGPHIKRKGEEPALSCKRIPV